MAKLWRQSCTNGEDQYELGSYRRKLAACSGSTTRESTGEYIDDAAITIKVKAAFLRDKEVKVTDIAVATFKGNVELTGFVSSRAEIDRALQIASRVPGVKTVDNDILVNTARTVTLQ